MPKGVPRFGSLPDQKPEVLGHIPADTTILDPKPQGTESHWDSGSGPISFSEEPPPWELSGGDEQMSDARRFVEAPADVTLRWINPRLLEQDGWRDWRPVLASDTRFKVHVRSMVAPDGNIRRGGAVGDILAFMPTHWVVSRRKLLEQRTQAQSQSAVDRQEALKDEMRRLSPFLHVDAVKHPTHTNADGRSMTDA